MTISRLGEDVRKNRHIWEGEATAKAASLLVYWQ